MNHDSPEVHALLYLLLTAVSLLTGYLGYRHGPVPIFVASVIGMAASMGVTDVLAVGILRLYIHVAWTAWMVSISSLARPWIIRPNLLTNPDSARVRTG